MRRSLIALLVAGLFSVTLVSPASAARPNTLFDVVDRTGEGFDSSLADFDVLEAAIRAAGLEGALLDEDVNWTVFAPRDSAFLRLARDLGYEGASDETAAFTHIVEVLTVLGDGDPIPILTDVLLYHVSPWKLRSSQVLARREINTLLGVNFKVRRGNVLVDNEPDIWNPRVIATDIGASNGIVHVLDRVLIPADL